MTSRTVRIAMLNAEVPVPAVLPRRGSFGNIFHNLLSAAASRISDNVDIISTEYDVRLGEYPTDLSQVDVIIITGSANSAYDNIEWIHRLDDWVLDLYINYPRIKMFGSCFGHQLICQSLLQGYGVRVEKDPNGFENGVHEITLTEDFRKTIFVSSKRSSLLSEDDVVEPLPETMRLQFVHGDHVKLPTPEALPSSWSLIGSTPRCAVQGVYEPGRVLTLQGHFEFDRFVNGETLKYFAKGLNWTPEALERYLDLVDADDDSEWVGKMVVRFFLEETLDKSTGMPNSVSGLLTPPPEE